MPTTTLREFAFDRATTAVGGQLGTDGGVCYLTEARRNDNLDPRVAVGGSLIRSERNNKQQSRTARVRIIVDGSEQFVETNGTLTLSDIQHSLQDELTKHSPEWGAGGLERMDPVAFDDAVNRYVGVQEWTFTRHGLHPQY